MPKQRHPLCFSIRFKMRSFSRTTKYYFCSGCQTHIVPERDLIHRVYRNGQFTGCCIFQHLNVSCSTLLDEDRVQTVHCMSCNTALGFKYVQVPAAQLCSLVQNERYNLNLERLSYWNGRQKVSGFAAMLPEPIPGPEPVFQLVPEPTLLTRDIDQHQALIDNNVIAPQPQPPNPPQGNGDEPPADVDVGEHASEA
uniref:uncharacterized protein LOC101302150 isoform X2 n=1 Tax=Fragaria vesca subsp. vesca TaxID=101020 RepID=UPI0005CA1BC5|nr:PREDICTED: uncharacterized protein LOC101302150 isoform X2 [Fragaria vesca subsp. vesca]